MQVSLEYTGTGQSINPLLGTLSLKLCSTCSFPACTSTDQRVVRGQVDKFTMKFLRAEFERAAEILQGEQDPLPRLFEGQEDRASSRS